MVVTSLEPPDGGYGWVVVFASVLNNFFMVPLIQNVGLIFKDKILEIDMSITQMLLTFNLHVSVGQITGLINNLLLQKFGYRKVAVAGVTFVFFGLTLSSWVHNSVGFVLTFGILAGLGMGLNTSSYTRAIKSYFIYNQNKAIGLSMTLTALGPILLPQILNLLIEHYHPDGVILILAGIIAHGYIGAVLLRPIKKHMIQVEIEDPEANKEKNTETQVQEELVRPNGVMRQHSMPAPREFVTYRRFSGFRRKDSVISVSYEQEATAIMGLDSTLGGSLYSMETAGQRRPSALNTTKLTKTTWWKSEESIHLNSSYDLFDENDTLNDKEESSEKKKNKKVIKADKSGPATPLDKTFHFEESKIYKELSVKINQMPWYKRWFYRLVELFGVDILLDLRYINIMLGVSMALFSEINFTVLLPFILDEYDLSISQIAAFLSVLGAADILFRFLAPQIGDCFKLPARVMIMLVLAAIIVARLVVILVRIYPTALAVAFLLGCGKGLRVVYMSLVIPSYVPKERLASASAIQIISNSCTGLLGGYSLGVVRSISGSYIYCIIFMDCVTALVIVMWLSDMVWNKMTKKSEPTDASIMHEVDESEVY